MTEFVGSPPHPEIDSDAVNGTDSDPFTIETPKSTQHHRFSAFDTQLFALNHPDSSPAQAKRALEAHLADTDRRIQETSNLGTTLVQQRVNLSNRLREVTAQDEGTKITPELRQKLIEIEREYNELGRQSAKTFLGPRGDQAGPDGRILPNRPVSPSKLASTAVDTPSRMSVPRKQRNQASSSDHIEFAAEITTSLLGQVRHLQAILAERDETLKNVTAEKGRLETEAEGFGQRLKHMDDSEQRYKDENWNLETQLQELAAQHKDAAGREQKLQQTLATLSAERTAYEKELEDLKQSHGKALEDHAALRKHHESEIANLRRGFGEGENEKGVLQRKIEELTSQNHDLARGLAAGMKGDASHAEINAAIAVEDFPHDPSDLEHSPPPSPSKGGQRNSVLESETLKSSLHHAHRMIQNLKTNMNRERSENRDLKRLLQEARDDMDVRRAEPQEKRLKSRSQTDIRKAGKAALGAARSSKTDILMNDPSHDPDWEDYDGNASQRQLDPKPSALRRLPTGMRTEHVDPHQTATEASDAFETANERETTDNDAFQTGAESMAGDSSETETETETAPTRGSTIRGGLGPSRISTIPGDRRSLQSTASTSDDEEQQLHTPIQGQPQRFRLKMNRRSRTPTAAPGNSTPNSYKDSPGSFVNTCASGAEGGQSLAAELDNMSGDEEDGTPSRVIHTPRSARSLSRDIIGKRSSGSLRRGPGSQPPTPGLRPTTVIYSNDAPPVPRIPTVDSGVNTEPWEPQLRTTHRPSSRPPSRVVSGSTNSTPQRTIWDQPLNASSGIIPGFEESANTTPMSVKSNGSQVLDVSRGVERPGETPEALALSPIQAIETSPTRIADKAAVVGSRSPVQPSETPTRRSSEAPSGGIFGSVFGWNRRSRTASLTRSRSASVIRAAEDLTAQKPADIVQPVTSDREVTLQEVPANAVTGDAALPLTSYQQGQSPQQEQELRRPSIYDQASQTVLSSEQIDRMLTRSTIATDLQATPVKSTMKPLSDIGASTPLTPTRGLQDDTTPKAKMPEVKIPQGVSALGKTIRRPTSASSTRSSRNSQYPPLPPDHQEAIAAAAQKAPESMGPPLAPASAYKRPLRSPMRSRPGSRSQTPSMQGMPNQATNGGTTPRAGRYATARSQVSRRSSISSFESELDQRFGIRMNGGPMQGMPANTDPRMIQAITQTMIGEHMWKYTRKAGRPDMSNTRHRRFFWVHPYTRTLYWSDRDPATANRAELKSKSVAIEAVRVVSDDNPNPPGLHRKSLVVVTPGRSVKFTAQTSHRHETWFNALSYLLLRTGGEMDNADGGLTDSDVAEFNPGHNRRSMRSRVSLASFRSSNTANRNVRESLSSRTGPVQDGPFAPPAQSEDERPDRKARSIRSRISRSLSRSRPSKSTISNPIYKPAEFNNATPHASISSRLSGYWRQPNSIRNSMRSRSSMRGDDTRTSGVEPGVLEGGGSVVAPNGPGDSAEDLRRVIEQRENQGGLENVRACCDGRHDVGSLNANGRHSHSHSHNYSHAKSTMSTYGQPPDRSSSVGHGQQGPV